MKNIKTTLAILSCSIMLSSNILADATLPPPIQDVVKMEKLAGPAGPFTTKENFPKDYFLMPKNLPYLVGMTLYDNSSAKLNLSKEQIEAILKIKDELMAKAAKKALVIKNLELEMMKEVSFKLNSKKATELYPAVDEIAKLRAELTKIHLDCIEKVKAVLTPEQFEEMLDYGVINMF
ncbi:hypothetical protein Suden_1229 [Sulfurimonas denitrificans DSM 1251]|uniref:Periplasmic protein n=1 Tax=Sulfurimonas denitrificans (strain ATCC 33889 / DSM 1251) TaxID=326298 RepID=Q30R74_SULDN|nr:hypothetical protein [Sulfurimonas denitrificans]ABB44507.1 hypothetical protein Suden_1229 [Sulfurimonas denitrificans DSM 1251]MDD3441689.1 hypothetical protein [Sulfurimonas denitrificans]